MNDRFRYNNVAIAAIVIFTFFQPAQSQEIKKDTSHFSPQRFYLFTGGSLVSYSASLFWLNELWYKDYPRSSFHFFNDNSEWLQIDKIGHCYTAYYESIIGMEGLKWSGVDSKKAALYGMLWGVVLQGGIEILDGFSSEWGFSAGDFTSNIMGSAFAAGQELVFHEQKILFKFSFHQTDFASKRPEVLGSSFSSNLLKDYNGQTYWLSTSFNNITGKKKIFPEWLCLSVGFGAEGMLGGQNNLPNFSDIERYRQFYISLDVNTLKLRRKNKYLNALLTAISVIKFPAPALEINTSGGNNIIFHYIYF